MGGGQRSWAENQTPRNGAHDRINLGRIVRLALSCACARDYGRTSVSWPQLYSLYCFIVHFQTVARSFNGEYYYSNDTYNIENYELLLQPSLLNSGCGTRGWGKAVGAQEGQQMKTLMPEGFGWTSLPSKTVQLC